MRLAAYIIILTIATLVLPAAERVKLRPDAAEGIGKKEGRLPDADRVEVYMTRAKWDVDRLSTVETLRKLTPNIVFTNRNEINQLFARLRPKGERAERGRLATRDGHTYHLLAFQGDGTAIHIRVFDTGEAKTSDAKVYLRPGASFSYLNDNIGPWLRANVPLNEKKGTSPPVTP